MNQSATSLGGWKMIKPLFDLQWLPPLLFNSGNSRFRILLERWPSTSLAVARIYFPANKQSKVASGHLTNPNRCSSSCCWKCSDRPAPQPGLDSPRPCSSIVEASAQWQHRSVGGRSWAAQAAGTDGSKESWKRVHQLRWWFQNLNTTNNHLVLPFHPPNYIDIEPQNGNQAIDCWTVRNSDVVPSPVIDIWGFQ